MREGGLGHLAKSASSARALKASISATAGQSDRTTEYVARLPPAALPSTSKGCVPCSSQSCSSEACKGFLHILQISQEPKSCSSNAIGLTQAALCGAGFGGTAERRVIFLSRAMTNVLRSSSRALIVDFNLPKPSTVYSLLRPASAVAVYSTASFDLYERVETKDTRSASNNYRSQDCARCAGASRLPTRVSAVTVASCRRLLVRPHTRRHKRAHQSRARPFTQDALAQVNIAF